MFTIVISEKGGTERRETSDKNEINVGRVQGNDLMLPKGNVSKHHARLLFRDGRFIVTDLKSTNGTYVNGRKISQATIVREGDKIYVGDFVLRLETGQKASTEAPYTEDELPAGGPPSSPRQASPVRDSANAVVAPPPSRGALPPPMPPVGVSSAMAGAAAAPMIAPAFPPPPRLPESDAASHHTLQREPDEGEVPSALRSALAPKFAGSPRVATYADPRGRAAAMGSAADRTGPQRALSSSGAPPPRAARSVPPPPPNARPAPRETPQQAARRLALITLVDRVADVVDLTAFEGTGAPPEGALQPIERAVREQAKAMRQEGEAPDGIDLDLLARDALREIVGLGPIGQLLEDDETIEVHVVRHDYVLASKNGQTTLAEPSFTSEAAMARIVARMAHQSGDPLHTGELLIDRRLARGTTMTAIAPPASSGWVLHVRKRRRVEATLAQLVSSGAMSEAVAAFLEASAAVRANVLVVGSGAGAVSLMLGAIASAAPPSERVAVLHQGPEEFVVPHAHVVLLALADHGPRGEQAVYAASRLGVDRLVITSLAGAVATATIHVIAEGSEGVLAGVSAPSLRHALARLVSQVAMAGAGSSVEAAREALGESFDLVVEVDRGADGRLRVVRVAELEGSDERRVITRDLFVLSTASGGETSYRATGVSPRIAHDFSARGVKLDGPNR